MAVKIEINGHYLFGEREVVVQAIEAGRVVAKLVGSDEIRIVEAINLRPMPEHADFEKHPAYRIDFVEWEQASKRAKILDEIIRKNTGITEEIKKAAQTLGISQRQVWRLYNVYKANPLTTALLGIKTGRREGARFLGQKREDIVQNCIDKDFLRREKPSVASLQNAIEVACHELGLKAPSLGTTHKRVQQLKLKDSIKKREGKKRAGEVCDGAAGHVEVSIPLKRIEIDHTLVDVILRDDTRERKVRGRPWLTLAIDVKTRMILGFYLSFETPSAASVAMCIAMIAIPKEAWLTATGVHGSWPAHGIPQQIWTDNAMEFRSVAIQRGCDQYQIQLCYRPVGSPGYGGTIERLNGTMMGQVHLLPGTTQSSVADLGDYDAEARATMTLSEFIPWFTEQVVTGYHLRPHRILGIPPLKMWEEATHGLEIKKPRDLQEYYASFLPAHSRVLTRTGVQLDDSTYWSDEFSPFIGLKKKVLVHFHRMDAEKVYVRLPDGRMAVAENMRPETKGLTFVDLKFRRECNRKVCKDPALTRERHEGFKRNQKRVEQSFVATREAKKIVSESEPPVIKVFTSKPMRLAKPSAGSFLVYIND